jgi:hypothetical protein
LACEQVTHFSEIVMKQVLLALVLVLVPVAAFTGFEAYARGAAQASSSLGDLSSFRTIVADVQAYVGKGDLTAARKRITDYESAWDAAETAIRPLNQTEWGNIDAASDDALKAIRAPQPSLVQVKKTLAALMAELNDPSKPVA